MPSKRLLGTIPTYNLDRLREEAKSQWTDCKDVNEINDGAQLAVYLDESNPATDSAWQAVLDAHDQNALSTQQQADADTQALKAILKTNAQSAVGLTPDLWTTAQMKALLAVLIFESGGLNADLTLKPLNGWVDK